MRQPKYDIFISYRRDGGAQYARTLQLMLEKNGYRVFLDYDELKDGFFSKEIEAAIRNSTIYMIVLSKGSLARCVNDDDWVRKEIEIAIEEGKHIVPVNPDSTFDGIPESLPPHIKEAVGGNQHSEISFGQALNATVDLMVKNRIKPYIPKRRRWIWYFVGLIVLVMAIIGLWRWKVEVDAKMALQEIEELKSQVTFQNVPLSWSPEISKEQILTVREILDSITLIPGGEFIQGAVPLHDGSYHKYVQPAFETPASRVDVSPFYLSKVEVTVGQWNAIMEDTREGDPSLPVASVTYGQAKEFARKLTDLCGISFRLPTESEWEYAAKGGPNQEGFLFAGSDDPDDVAWFESNSGGVPHSDLKAVPTDGDLFNMSGNVSEWTDTEFVPYDPDVPFSENSTMVTRGGNFDSMPYEITVTRRDPVDPETSISTLGFRLAIDK